MMPELGPEDMPDIETLSHEELQKVPFDKVKWFCCVENCKGFTTIQDFGIAPRFYWQKKWFNLSQNDFFCSRHWPIVKKDIAAGKPISLSMKDDLHIQITNKFKK